MQKIFGVMVACLGLWGLPLGRVATGQPTSQPAPGSERAGRPGAQGGGRGEIMLDRFRQAVAELNLDQAQKEKITAILTATAQEVRGMLPQLQKMQPTERQAKIRELMTGVRQKIVAELSDEQAKKLEEKLAALRGAGGRAGRPPGASAPGDTTMPPVSAPPVNAPPVTAPPVNAPPATAPPAATPEESKSNPSSPASAGDGQPKKSVSSPDVTPARGGERVQQAIQRLQESLATLSLSEDQKKQARAIVDDGKKQLAEMRDKVQAGAMKADELRAEVPKVLAAMRDQLAGVLTKQQQEKLRDAIQTRYDRDNAAPPATAAPATAPSGGPAINRESPQPRTEPGEPNRGGAERNAPQPQATAHPDTGAPGTALPDTGPKIGATAPDFSLEGLNGRPVQLSSFKNKPLVIEFGSYSSPSFRQRAARMEELAHQYGTRANFLLIYTKEAHPVGGWEIDRNADDGVRVLKHADLAARKAAAKDARTAMKISIPIAVDTMEDSIATAYGAGENSAVLIGRDGKVLARQSWCDAYRLKAALDQALATKVVSSSTNEK